MQTLVSMFGGFEGLASISPVDAFARQMLLLPVPGPRSVPGPSTVLLGMLPSIWTVPFPVTSVYAKRAETARSATTPPTIAPGSHHRRLRENAFDLLILLP